MDCKIKYLPGARRLKINPKGNWIDLYAYEDTVLCKDDYGLLSLGVAMELPEGYEANIVPRSSTFKTWGILQTNHFGVVDNNFKGDGDIWHFPYYSTRNSIINQGDKIGQFRIQKIQPRINFIEVDSLGNNNRGGFGSTGER